MAYKIRLYSEYVLGSTGTIPEVEDKGIYYNQSSLPMIGIGTTGYAASIAEALIWNLENFAGVFPPANPLTGQLWYDTGSSQLKIYNNGTWGSPLGELIQPEDGESFTWRGNWVSNDEYARNDVVYYSGSSYICVANRVKSTKNPSTDTTSWDQMSAIGATGATGAQGAAGSPGSTGATGPAGTSFIWRGEWDKDVNYEKNDVVSYQDSTYICVTKAYNQTSFDTSKWNLMAKAGESGASFTYKGDYNATTTYVLNDVIYHPATGCTYISKSANNKGNTPPSTSWGLMAEKGADGASGAVIYVSSTQPPSATPGSLWFKT